MAEANPSSGIRGILYFDPTPTSAKLARASLQLGGYKVFHAPDSAAFEELYLAHGPEGERILQGVLVDASRESEAASSIVASYAKLPLLLLASRRNPVPFVGAEKLPTLKRPFGTPALLKAIADLLENAENSAPPEATKTLTEEPQAPAPEPTPEPTPEVAPSLETPLETSRETSSTPDGLAQRTQALLLQHLPQLAGIELPASALEALAQAWGAPYAPAPAKNRPSDDATIQSQPGALSLELWLELLDRTQARGRLKVDEQVVLWVEKGTLQVLDCEVPEEDFSFERFLAREFDDEKAAKLAPLAPEPLRAELGDELFLKLHAQRSQEVLGHLFRGPTPALRFEGASETESPAASSQLTIPTALLGALRQRDEREQMGGQMPEVDDVFLRLDEAVTRIDKRELSRDELAVLEQLNGRNTVKDIARKMKQGTFAVARTLYRLQHSQLTRKRIPATAVSA